MAELLRGRGHQVALVQRDEDLLGEGAPAAETASGPGATAPARRPLPALAVLQAGRCGPGLSLLRRLRTGPGGETPFLVLLLERDTPEDRHAGLDAGADECVSGPDEISARLPTIERSLALRAWLREAPPEEGESPVTGPLTGEDRLRTLEKALDATQVGVTVCNLDGRIIYVNAADARQHGYTVEELMGQDVGVYAVGGARTPLGREQIPEVRSWCREGWNARRDGTPFRVSLLSDVILSSSGEPIGLVTACADVTERWQAQEALQESRASLAAILENTGDAIWSVDASLKLRAFNAAFRALHEQMTGRAPEAGEPLFEAPDDVRSAWSELHRRGLKERFTVHRTLGAGEERRHLEFSLSPIRAGGKPTGVAVFARDVTARYRAEQALRESESRLASARGANDGLWEWDPLYGAARFSSRWKAMLGFADHEIADNADEWFSRLHPEDDQRVRHALALHLAGETDHYETEHRVRHRDGSWRWMRARGVAVRDEEGRAVRVVGSQVEVTDRKLADEALRRSEERYALAARGANDGLWDWDLVSDTLFLSPRWKEMLGYGEDEIGASPDEWSMRVHVADRERLKAELQAHLAGEQAQFRSEHRVRHRDGGWRWVLCRAVAIRGAGGEAVRLAGSMSDITDRKSAEERVLHDALHDGLTGLPNRTLFLDRLKLALARSRRGTVRASTVLALGLERLDLVDDALGHVAGGRLRQVVVRRLQGLMRAVDTLARSGDDLFVLLDGFSSVPEATAVVERLQAAAREPVSVDGNTVSVRLTAGLAVASAESHPVAEDALRDAQTALFAARLEGASLRVFEPGMRERAARQLERESALREALRARRLALRFEPVLSLAERHLVGFALAVGWPGPEPAPRGETPLAVAEAAGLVPEIERWALAEGLRQLAPTLRAAPLRLTATASGESWQGDELGRALDEALAAGGLRPSALELSLRGAGARAALFAEELGNLRRRGVRLQLADYAESPVAVATLARLGFDSATLGGPLVEEVDRGGDAVAALRALVDVAHALRLRVVARGLARPPQAEVLRSLGCDEGRGLLVSPPLDAAGVAEFARACARSR